MDPPALFLEGEPSTIGARGFERADRRGFFSAALERTPRAAFQVVVFETHETWTDRPADLPVGVVEHGAAGLRDPGWPSSR